MCVFFSQYHFSVGNEGPVFQYPYEMRTASTEIELISLMVTKRIEKKNVLNSLVNSNSVMNRVHCHTSAGTQQMLINGT